MDGEAANLLLTFRTTSDAIAAELHLQAARLPGRLIPVPVRISASCGFAWTCPARDEAAVLERLRAAGIEPEGSYRID